MVAKPQPKLRYIADETTWKKDAYLALSSHFSSYEDFERFYSSLGDSETKNEFLRAAAFYLFFVKSGNWHVYVDRSNPVIDYITNSFKLATLFSLIESLSDKKYKDFYQWLCNEVSDSDFQIVDQAMLSNLYERYKDTYGSVRRCKAFFDNLPSARQKVLCSAIKIGEHPLDSVTKVAEFLYDSRSKFMHEAQMVLELGSGIHFSRLRNKVVQSTLSIDVLLESVEEGILAYFDRVKIDEN